MRIWQSSASRVDFAYPLLRAHYAVNGERIRDRDGHVHRIAAPGPRYPCALTLSVLPQELALPAVSPIEGGESVLVWLERMLRYQAQLILFCDGASVMPDAATLPTPASAGGSPGLPYTRRLAWRGVLDIPPADGFALLPGLEDERVELGFSVHETGSFTNYSSVGSYAAE
jgi:hypothetical protein